MSQKANDDIELIEEAMNRFVQAKSRPRAWERMRAHAGVDLDRAGAALLHVLEHPEYGTSRLSDVAHKMGIEAPSVSRKVQQLESEGLIARVADPEDGRASVLKITVKGQQVIERLHRAHHEQFADILQDWPAGDRAAFAKLFNRLSKDFELHTQTIYPTKRNSTMKEARKV